MLKKIFEGKLF
jgi:WD40 repeat protein